MFTPKIPSLLKRLTDHLKVDLATLPVIEQRYDFYHRANIHLGIETLSKSSSNPYQLIAGGPFTQRLLGANSNF